MSNSIFDQARFQNAEAAREYLESVRWPDGPACPHCGVVGKHYALNGNAQRAGLYKCSECREQFTVTVGTVFERSKVPLHKWVMLTELMCASKKGISSKQVERMLGVTYKTAWFMTHRIREAMKPNGGSMLGSGGGTVEADETFIGRKPGRKIARGYAHKEAVLSLVERGGKVRSFPVPDVTANTLKATLKANASKEARLMTDDAGQYRNLRKEFASREVVNHSAKEYVRGNARTNTIEGFFSIFKRGIYGVFQHVSSHHLHRYTAEFDFKYNHLERLGFDYAARTVAALKRSRISA